MSKWQDREDCPLAHTEKTDGVWVRGDNEDLGTLRQSNGLLVFKMRCRKCDTESGALPNALAREFITDHGMTIRWERSNAPRDYAACTVRDCDEPGREYHHFAPRNVFGWAEADRWPLLPLCLHHHRFWHLTMDGYRWNARSVDR